MIDNGSCIRDGSVQVKDLERVLNNGLLLDHMPELKMNVQINQTLEML